MKAKLTAVSRYAAISLLGMTWVMTAAFGWGSYGHEQVNRAAALAISDQEIGKLMVKSIDAVQRLAVTPDYDWKKVGTAPDNEDLVALRFQADRYEHPLHYFEPDAFIKDGKITVEAANALPIGAYHQIWGQYATLLVANLDHVLEIDPEKALSDPTKPNAKEVSAHGTAPWRIAQLFELGVEKLKAKDYKAAVHFLGAMGHYVGDLSQPFHGSLDFDGKAYESDAAGIHSAFETKVFEQESKKVGATWDKDEKMWDNFSATEDAVVALTKEKLRTEGLESDEAIVRRLFRLVARMNRFIEPLEAAFAEAKEEEQGDAVTIRVATVKAFMVKKITDPKDGKKMTVLEAAKTQLSRSSALLAQLWMEAYRLAKSQNSQVAAQSAPKVRFSQKFILENYPKPMYLPQLKENRDEQRPVFRTAAAWQAAPKTPDPNTPCVRRRCRVSRPTTGDPDMDQDDSN